MIHQCPVVAYQRGDPDRNGEKPDDLPKESFSQTAFIEKPQDSPQERPELHWPEPRSPRNGVGAGDPRRSGESESVPETHHSATIDMTSSNGSRLIAYSRS